MIYITLVAGCYLVHYKPFENPPSSPGGKIGTLKIKLNHSFRLDLVCQSLFTVVPSWFLYLWLCRLGPELPCHSVVWHLGTGRIIIIPQRWPTNMTWDRLLKREYCETVSCRIIYYLHVTSLSHNCTSVDVDCVSQWGVLWDIPGKGQEYPQNVHL